MVVGGGRQTELPSEAAFTRSSIAGAAIAQGTKEILFRRRVSTHRPFFNEELQQVCLDVRRRNVGIDGKPIFFHCRGGNAPIPTMPKRKPKTTKPNQYVDLLDGLEALGLAATAEQVGDAMRFLYPNGVGVADENDVLRSVFLHIKRQIASDFGR